MAFRDHARKRVFERFNVVLDDRDFDQIEANIRSGNHFEKQEQGERTLFVMNVPRLGANLAVIWDNAYQSIVTILPSKRSFRVIAKREPIHPMECLVEYDNSRVRRKMRIGDHVFLGRTTDNNDRYMVSVYRRNGYLKDIEVVTKHGNTNKIIALKLLKTKWL